MKSALPSPLAVEQWPQPDQDAWTSALQGDPLASSGAGGAAGWRPSTVRQNSVQYGGWLGWLREVGALDVAATPGSRASRERVRSYLDALERAGLADYSRAGRLQALADILRVIDPGTDVRFIGRAAGRIASQAKRARDLRPRIRPPVEVLKFGLELMASAEAEASGVATVDRAYAFRDGLLIALWAHRPLRISNLAGIELDRTLRRVGAAYRLSFDDSEMKGARPFSCAWPEKLQPALETYLETYRPILLSRATEGLRGDQALWISQFGKGMTKGSIGQIIRLRTQARFGEPLNPHLMRYLTATFYAASEPEMISDVAAVLHHANLETTEQHYILSNSMRAVGLFQERVLATTRRTSGG